MAGAARRLALQARDVQAVLRVVVERWSCGAVERWSGGAVELKMLVQLSRRLAVCVLLVGLSTVHASQLTAPEVFGQVVDRSQVLPGVTIVLRPIAVGPAITAVTDREGRFRISVPR